MSSAATASTFYENLKKNIFLIPNDGPLEAFEGLLLSLTKEHLLPGACWTLEPKRGAGSSFDSALSFLWLLSSFSIMVNGHQLCFGTCRCVRLTASVAQRKTWAGAQWSSHRGINDQLAWLMAQRIVGPCGFLHINGAIGGEAGESNEPLAFKSI